MRAEYSIRMPGRLVTSDGAEHPLSAELVYRPRSCQLEFHLGMLALTDAEQVWVWWQFHRDLLRDGLIESAGLGDVQIAPTGYGEVALRLLGEDGEAATVYLPSPRVGAWALRMDRIVPPGREVLDIDWDRALAGWSP